MLKCRKLQDEVDGTVVGCGYASVQNQLENRVSYVKRLVSAYRKACGVKKRLNEGTDIENQKTMKPVMAVLILSQLRFLIVKPSSHQSRRCSN